MSREEILTGHDRSSAIRLLNESEAKKSRYKKVRRPLIDKGYDWYNYPLTGKAPY